MISQVYSIRDNKVGHFGTPFFSQNDITASRQLAIAAKDRHVQISHFPEDFDLHLIGVFDDESGKVEPVPNGPKFVIGAISCKKMEGNNETSR